MNPITPVERLSIETRLGYAICPFTQVRTIDAPGIMQQAEQRELYVCFVDGKDASGGGQSELFGAAMSPCPLVYARGCELMRMDYRVR